MLVFVTGADWLDGIELRRVLANNLFWVCLEVNGDTFLQMLRYGRPVVNFPITDV